MIVVVVFVVVAVVVVFVVSRVYFLRQHVVCRATSMQELSKICVLGLPSLMEIFTFSTFQEVLSGGFYVIVIVYTPPLKAPVGRSWLIFDVSERVNHSSFGRFFLGSVVGPRLCFVPTHCWGCSLLL